MTKVTGCCNTGCAMQADTRLLLSPIHHCILHAGHASHPLCGYQPADLIQQSRSPLQHRVCHAGKWMTYASPSCVTGPCMRPCCMPPMWLSGCRRGMTRAADWCKRCWSRWASLDRSSSRNGVSFLRSVVVNQYPHPLFNGMGGL